VELGLLFHRFDKLPGVLRFLAAAASCVWLLAGPVQAASLDAVSLAKAPVLDGKIDEGEWAGAKVSEQGFVQFEPGFGNPAAFRTTVRVGQTATSLFVAIEAFDPEIANLSASVTRRDGITNLDANDPVRSVVRDDAIAVFLDATGDGRTAYIFRTNALATQEDARITDNGRAVDMSWDGIWRNAAMRYEDRWIVEFEIPFATLIFNSSDRPWKINFVRTVPRRLETDVWSGPSPSVYRVSEFGDLTLIKPQVQSADASWQIIPYSTMSYEVDKGARGLFGADIRWRPSSNLGADVTLNPDFSLVDPDIEIVNLTRFEVLVPERRPFFLEGTEMYNQRYRQFNSRRLGNISWGAKTNGKVGGTDFSVIAASENSRLQAVPGESSAYYGIARVQQSLWRGSSVGLLATNRTLDGVNTGTAGLDTTMFITETFNFTGQIYRVHGAGADGGLVWYVRPSYDSARTHFHVRWGHFAPGILRDANALGFLQDDNRKEIDTNFGHTFFFASGLVERVRPSVNYNRFTGFDQSVLRGWALAPRVAVVLRSRLEFDISRRDEYRLFDKGYQNHETTLTAGWNNRQGRSVFVYAGKGINFDNDLLTYGGEARWVVGDNWRLSYNLARVELAPDYKREDTTIHVFDTTYSFTPDLFVRGFVQTNSAIGKETFQILGVWRFRPPFGAFQVAYQKGTSAFGQVSTQGHTFFTKLSWVL
jgi:Domain of unknown function (DUF5916)